MKKRAPALWTALFFVLLTGLGLLAAPGYGLPLDGPSEQVILQENLKEYAVLLLGESSAPVQGYTALGIQSITQSIEMDHGQAAYYAAAPLLALKNENPALFNTLWHMYTWLWFMAGVLSVYAIARSLGMGRVLACATALMLYLSPRFFAEGHYNNKDIVLLSLSLWTVAAGIRLWQKPTVRRGLWFALAGALAANLRIIGFFVFGVMGVAAVVTLALRRALHKQALQSGAAAILGFAAAYTLLTPAFLVNPPGFITHLLSNTTAFSRWTGVVIFKGAVYDPTNGLPLPHSYLPTMILYTVPVAVLLLAGVGAVYAVALCVKRDGRSPALLSLMALFLVPFLYVVLARPLMYNGWRHFYFLYGPIVIMAGVGLLFFEKLLAKRRWTKAAGAAVLAGVLLFQGIGIAQNHPYEYAYYNELVRNEQIDFELDYWELSTLNALQQLAACGERNTALPLVIGGGDPMSLFSLNQSVRMLQSGLRGTLSVTEAENPPYVFSNTTYAQIYGERPGAGYRALFTIQSYGNVLCTVYERAQ